jgi:hypothetical protein
VTGISGAGSDRGESTAAHTSGAHLRDGDHLEYLSPNELAVILNEREADALLAVLETALNDGVTPGVGLRVEDARAAGFKIVSERFRDQDPYNRGLRLVATVARRGTAMPDA